MAKTMVKQMSSVPVSLIVPVYNAEKTLPAFFACIDAQTLESFEVIFIDDGSTDSSLELLHNYAASRDNIIVATQERTGVGPARNVGLRLAKGSYIAFADADDTFTPDFLHAPYLHAIATLSDIVVFDYEEIVAPNQCRPAPSHSEFFGAATNGTLSWRNAHHIFPSLLPPLWNKLWSRNFIESNKLVFFNLCSSSDRVFTSEAILVAERISYLPMVLYSWDVTPHGNITGTIQGDNLLASITGWEHIVAKASSQKKYLPLFDGLAYSLVLSQWFYWEKYQGDWGSAKSREYVTRLHKLFNNQYLAKVESRHFVTPPRARFFETIRDFEPEQIINAAARGGLEGLLGLSETLHSPEKADSSEASHAIETVGGTEAEDADIPSVSVIVPVYNAEETLPALFACIDRQTLESFEVIFIDDGSTDSSQEFLQEYAASRENIVVLSQEHSGPGPARNAGLRTAQGAYIAFADADDTFEPDFLNAPYMHALATMSDLVVFDFEKVTPSGRDSVCHPGLLSAVTSAGGTVSWRSAPNVFDVISPNVWNKLWNRDFIKANNFFFWNMRSAEDRVFVTEAILAANRISYLPVNLYSYQRTPHNSIVHTIGSQNLLENITAWEHIVAIVSSDKKYRPLRVSMVRALVSGQLFYKKWYTGDWEGAQTHEYRARLCKLLNSHYFRGISGEDFACVKQKNFFLAMKENGSEEDIVPLDSPNVSVIVPVYNAEGYLSQLFACFDAQICESFEVIFVDDGSTDSSVALLDDYVSRHDNMMLLSQNNRGAGSARNAGLEQAKGDYIVFVDADDVFSPMFLESLQRKAVDENADIVVYGYVLVFNGKETTNYPRVCDAPEFKNRSVFSWRDAPDRIVPLTGHQATWNRLYRRTFLLEKGLKFPEVSASNDWPFAILAVFQAERIAWLNEAPYIHIRRLGNDSITAKKQRGHSVVLEACAYALQRAQKLPHYEYIRSSLWAHVAHELWMAVVFYDWTRGENKEMKDFLARIPSFCRDFGITDKDMNAIARANFHVAQLLTALSERPVDEIEQDLAVPFVLALYGQHFDDVRPVVETQARRLYLLDFHFSAIDVYLPCGESVDNTELGVLADYVDNGWLRIHQLAEGSESEWFREALADNPNANCVMGNMDKINDGYLELNSFAVSCLQYPGAVLASSTRTVLPVDGSIVEPEQWLETATISDGPSANLWVDTSEYYCIPRGFFDAPQQPGDVCVSLPQKAGADDEYVLNSALLSTGVQVVSLKRELPEIHDVTCEAGSEHHDDSQDSKENHDSVVDSDVPYEELLEKQILAAQERYKSLRKKASDAQYRASRLEGELEKARFAADILAALPSKYSPLSLDTEKLRWGESKQSRVKIAATQSDYNHGVALKAAPGQAYRAILTLDSGSASGFEIRLYDLRNERDIYRKRVAKNESLDFVFALFPEAEKISLLVYPEAIGSAAGHDAVIRTEIYTADLAAHGG